MNLEKYFTDSFNCSCVFTNHALQRIQERFMLAELSKLRILIQAGIKTKPLNSWSKEQYYAIVDPRFNFGLLANYNNENNTVLIITFIRGKTPNSYKHCETIVISIMKEKAEQEVEELNRLRQQIILEKQKKKMIS